MVDSSEMLYIVRQPFLFLFFIQINGNFPINCLHVAIVEMSNGPTYVHATIHTCCQQCHFPKFVACMRRRRPYWFCAGRVYKCIYDCRNVAFGISLSGRRRSATNAGRDICEKKSCNNKYLRGQCCTENNCIKLYAHQTKSPLQRPYSRFPPQKFPISKSKGTRYWDLYPAAYTVRGNGGQK